MDCHHRPQAPLSMAILQARIVEWAAMPSSRGSSPPRDGTRISEVSCIGRRALYHWCQWEALKKHLNLLITVMNVSKHVRGSLVFETLCEH